MRLRRLKLEDAPYMLEWMHDASVTENLNTDFKNKTLRDCEEFIKNSLDDKAAIHMAVVDESDIYQGTVSLKHINQQDSCAEFAITMRKSAMGTGYAQEAMKTILRFQLNGTIINHVYWCVKPENIRARRFYDKNGYRQSKEIPHTIKKYYIGQIDLIWYVWENCDNAKKQGDKA